MCQVYKIAERSDAVAIATRMVENGYLIPAEISGQFFFEDNEEAFYAHQVSLPHLYLSLLSLGFNSTYTN